MISSQAPCNVCKHPGIHKQRPNKRCSDRHSRAEIAAAAVQRGQFEKLRRAPIHSWHGHFVVGLWSWHREISVSPAPQKCLTHKAAVHAMQQASTISSHPSWQQISPLSAHSASCTTGQRQQIFTGGRPDITKASVSAHSSAMQAHVSKCGKKTCCLQGLQTDSNIFETTFNSLVCRQ